MSPSQIAGAARMQTNNTKQLLFKMANDGEVLKSSVGWYVHPDRADLCNNE